MVDIRHVLCAVDFSECSRRALNHAIAVAKWYGAWLSVLHVHPVSPPPIAASAAPLSPADQAELLAHLRAFVPDRVRGVVPVEFLVLEGNAAEDILAEAEHADLVVLGTHGRSGLEHLVLGSVAENVVRAAGCPVMTIPRAAPDGTAAVPDLFRHIVAGVDGSDASLDALTFAVSLAEEADAHLTVLRVLDLPRELAEWASWSPEGRAYAERWKASVLTRLHQLVPESARRYCHVDEQVEPGRPAHRILRLAAEQHTGLIVIGARGHSVIGRMLFGSTAQDIVRGAGCPVLTLRRQGHLRGRLRPHGMAPGPGIPQSVQAEHRAIHAALEDATKAPGLVGVVARRLAKLLQPHFVREEEIALPPLGLLASLAAGRLPPGARDVLPMTDALKRELPGMRDEHTQIRAAVEQLRSAARAEHAAVYEQLAAQLALHAQTEEEVLYPAAVLVGEVVRARITARPAEIVHSSSVGGGAQ